jgi:hypothetical protein
MQSMMKRSSVVRVVMLASATLTLWWAGAPCSFAQDTSQADLAKRVDDLEKELAALKSQMAATPAAAPAAASAAVSTPAPAAPAGPTIGGLLGPVTLSGFVDTYYGYNSNQPLSRTTAYRNFDINSDQFSLNMLELVADKAPDPAASHLGFHIALGYGQAMNAVNATEIGPGGTELNFDQYLKEGYIEYLATKKLQINVGKFVTPAGAEVIESKDNWNYSRGLLFAWAIPYFHYGMSAKYTFNSKFALTGYLTNGWNNSVDNNSGKTGGFSLAWTPNAKWSVIENYLTGPEHPNYNSRFRNLSDTVISYTPNAKWALMANYDYGSDTNVDETTSPFTIGPKVHWDGIAGYIKYAPNDKWYISTRGEYFQDVGGFETGVSQNMGEFTLTLQRVLAKKLMSRLEYRYDTSDQDVFPDNNGPFKGYQNTFTVGLIYAFSTADAK